jgi:PAS domain S-box-containing protein
VPVSANERKRKLPWPNRGWIAIGPEGFCYDVSNSFAAILGLPKVRFLARNWTFLVHPDDHELVRRVADMLQGDTLPPPLKLRWLKRDNTAIWLEIRFMRRRDTQRNHFDLIIGTVRKIQEAAA